MNWERLLRFAHRIGWPPSVFWSATMYELDTAIDEAVRMSRPPKAKRMPDKLFAAFLMSKAKR